MEDRRSANGFSSLNASHCPHFSHSYTHQISSQLKRFSLPIPSFTPAAHPSPGSSDEYLPGSTVVYQEGEEQPSARHWPQFTATQKAMLTDTTCGYLPPLFRKRQSQSGFKAVTQCEGLLAKRDWLNEFHQGLEEWVRCDSTLKLWKGY